MGILFNERTKEFHLQGRDVSYIFSVLRNEQLGHLYYGKKLKHRPSFQHFLRVETRGASASVYEGELAFSLETIKQEYPSYGTTDFREPAYQLLQQNGSRVTNFEYDNHKIYKGKKPLNGLPATYVEEESEATSVEVELIDKLLNASLILTYTVYEDRNIITRHARFEHRGEEPVDILRIMSGSIDLPTSNYEMVQLSGAWIRERHVKTRMLQPGIQSISSARGTSSSQQNPFLILKNPAATEHSGEAYGFSLVYSGNFLGQVEVDHYNVSRITMGIHPFDFQWRLESGQTFQSPELVLAYSNNGLNGLSQEYHELYRKRLARGKWRDLERPVLINNWEATYFDFNEEKIVHIAKEAQKLGVELFVLDDGWFGKRNDDTTSLGDWFVDENKLPGGMKSLAQKVTDLGMDFGLWFEPEMISKQSNLYEKHPDWLIHVPNRHQSHGRNQYVLDFSREEVVNYIYERMEAILSEAPISYIKWDMNRNITEIGSVGLPANRQFEVVHRYILGVYDLYERLTKKFPDILFESCASGGARFDPGMLYYAPQAWTSDNTDAIERLKIQYGTSFAYPISSMGAHVSAVPNHQVRRVTSLETRGDVAYFGAFGYELDVTLMTEGEKETVKKQIQYYKKYRSLIQNGRFYRLKSPFEQDGNVTSWMVVSSDQKQAIIGYYQVLARSNPSYERIELKGLHPDYEYTVMETDQTAYGDELMYAGIALTHEYPGVEAYDKKSGDFVSVIYTLQAQ
ncbi:Alpha-galactosidase [Priestia megaterium Q3]|uniref:Alpha-galactosidase n=1 Tax=Priestia megaterium Q3 TaxID=1452722 RepID=A0A806TWJ8_PRIMG|nr:alpha-galactosidase [Priestia megaterium]AKP75446.1 Alpha-galactosidase [Priestia megaterium Q3]